jgi:hypothetical protein
MVLAVQMVRAVQIVRAVHMARAVFFLCMCVSTSEFTVSDYVGWFWRCRWFWLCRLFGRCMWLGRCACGWGAVCVYVGVQASVRWVMVCDGSGGADGAVCPDCSGGE